MAAQVLESPKREKCVIVNKTGRSGRHEEHFDIRLREEEFGVCPAVVWSCFDPVFPRRALFPPFGMVMYILCYCMLGVYNLHFDFTGSYN